MPMRIIGALFVAIGLVVAVHTVVEPLYHVSGEDSPYSPLWTYINPLMALAIIAGVILGYRRKMALDAEGDDAPVTRAYIGANALLYGFLFIGILFFFNWFNYMTPSYTAVGADAMSVIWAVIDAALSVLCLGMGLALWREESN